MSNRSRRDERRMGQGKRILITGVSNHVGLRLAKRFEHDDQIEAVVGVDLQEPPVPIGKLEFVRADIRDPLIARVLDSTGVDSLIHTNISSHPSRLGGRSPVSYTHLRAHETKANLVCRL